MAKSKNKNIISQSAIWIMMAMLVFSLGGFGIAELGSASRSLGEVGGKQIDIDEYARQLSQELNQLSQNAGTQISFAQAQQWGIDQAVLARLVRARALDSENENIGLSIGDETLRDEILRMPGFQGLDGAFDRDTYAFALQQAGLSEAAFETRLREDAARNLLQSAIATGAHMPPVYARTLADFAAQERAVTYIRLGADDLDVPLTPPTDAELRAFYDDNPDMFEIPPTRQISYIALTPDMLASQIKIDEARLRAAYKERSDLYNTPEQRLIDQLRFSDTAAAQAARARIKAGEISFDALVYERDLLLRDVDLGFVTRDDLEPGTAAAIFDAQVGDISGPLPTDLGPALFRINAITPAAHVSFDEAKEGLEAEFSRTQAIKDIAGLAEDLDDQLAGGTPLKELGQSTPAQFGQISWHPGVAGDLATDAAFGAAAARAQSGDFPQIDTLDNGGVFALRLDGTTPARTAPYNEVDQDVRAAFADMALTQALSAHADALAARITAGAKLNELDLTTQHIPALSRQSYVPGAPPELTEQLFDMPIGALEIAQLDDAVILVQLDKIIPAPQNPVFDQIQSQLAQSADQSLSSSLLLAFDNEIILRAGQRIDQAVLNAVHVNFQ